MKLTKMMPFTRFFICAALLLKLNPLAAQHYAQGWDFLYKNSRAEAEFAFKRALNDPKTATDAALMLMYLSSFDGHEIEGKQYWQKISKSIENPYPYIYAMWTNAAFVGSSAQQSDEQEAFCVNLAKDPNAPSTLRASAYYELGQHYITKDKFKLMYETMSKCNNITEWQYVGPFDNVSGSGFDKVYPPIAQPQSDTAFRSVTNAEIRWFAPAPNNKDGWTIPAFNIKWNTGITYAQTFVTSPSERDVILGFGMTGNAKIWINDRFVFSELEERKTDFDVFQTKIHLKKGVNRVLVQLGYEDESFSNFSLRFVDEKGNLQTDLVSSSQFAAYQKDNTEGIPARLPFFGEAFFEEKIKAQPDNLLNYILLGESYRRAGKGQEALQIIDKALEKAPDCGVLHYERLACYSKTQNRTGLVEEISKIKELDETCLLTLRFKLEEELRNEKYEDAQKVLDKMVELYGEDEETVDYQLKIYSALKKMEPLIKLAEEAYNKFPLNSYYVGIKYNLVLQMRKDPAAAIAVYEQFLKKNYALGVVDKLSDIYLEQGMNSKALAAIKKLEQAMPNDVNHPKALFDYHYSKKENEEAQKYLNKILQMTPFSSSAWNLAAKLAEQMDDKAGALKYYQKALHYNQNDYDARRKIRELEKKSKLDIVFPKIDYYDLLKKAKPDEKKSEHNWYYVLKESNTIVYPERNSETWHTVLVKVLTDKGIDAWKESSLGYNSNRQRLIIEKAEVVKPNGSKLAAEQNGNHIVFTNLQKGDGLVIRYRVVSYSYGRMSREFWDDNLFNMYVPIDMTRYALLISNNVPLEIKAHHFESKPTIKQVDDYKLYTWEMANEPALEDEKSRPALTDVGKVLHVSTLSDWSTITSWYGNVSAAQAKQDYDVKKVCETLFPAGNKFSETEKAKMIYQWILKNIRYSSVSFRQSGYVPQRASKVIQTKLGDCKDVSTLYAAIAREIGMKAQLVLVNTRDNGDDDMLLPSMEFNHCIVKVIADGKPWYLELTNPDLSFGSLPNSDLKAFALEIPFNETNTVSKPFKLNPDNRNLDKRSAKMSVQIKNRDLVIDATCVRNGDLASHSRNSYQNLPKNKMIEKVQKSIGGNFTNPVTVKSFEFPNLESLSDTAQFQVKYQIKNEVIEVGDLSTIKIPYYSSFVRADAFQDETRTLPVNYWQYEDCDLYNEDITVQLPDGKQFTDIPKNISLNFNGTQYSLKFEKKSPTIIQVKREIKVNRENVSVADYANFRKFIDDVLAAEAKYIAFK
jgi:tetratricopeptide (TPR) repeat protein